MQLKPITAIIVLSLVVASLLVAGCTNNTSPSSNTAGGNAGVALTVNSQTTLNTLGSGVLSSTPKPGYKYDVFDVTVTNLNRNDLAMGNPLYFKLTTKDGTVYSYSPSEIWLDNDIQPVSGTNPGEKVTGQVAFEIPQSATATTLTYNDGVLGNIVSVKLTSSNQSSSTPAQISSIPSTSVMPTPTSTVTPTPSPSTTAKIATSIQFVSNPNVEKGTILGIDVTASGLTICGHGAVTATIGTISSGGSSNCFRTAYLDTSGLNPGTYDITLKFSGDSTYRASQLTTKIIIT